MSKPIDLYHGLFRWYLGHDGAPSVARDAGGATQIPCPTTGRPLHVETIDAEAAAICPRCSSLARGGFVSFVGDLRMAYACPSCRELVWLAGI
jgi:hypothetical protein